MRRLLAITLFAVLSCMPLGRAFAQPSAGAWRAFLDTNVLGVDWVETTQRGVPRQRTTLVTVGPNQLGASRLWIPTTPLGFGAGYIVKSGWMLDVRAGFGLDVLATKDDAGTPTYVAWSFMPGLTWMPPRMAGKLFLKFSPVLDFVQFKQGGERQRYFGGCFSVGAGSFLFTGEHASVDLGLFFEGRFPDVDKKPDNVKVEYTDLRTVARMGFSLWR